jgi:alpha-L-fucosidase
MFDSALTDFKITNSAFRRDVAGELSQACAQTDIKLGFYYSPRDWDHPDYLPHYQHFTKPSSRYGGWWGYPFAPLTGRLAHPNGLMTGTKEAEDFEDCGCSACRANRPIVEDRDATKADLQRYLRYERGHIDELLSRYGDIKILWFDGQEHNPQVAGTEELLAHVRSLKSDIIVNDRIGTNSFQADFGVAEQYIPEDGDIRDWESCLTIPPYSWGYDRDEHNFLTPAQIIRQVIEVVSKGGNILINISPDEMGLVPEYQIERLRALGRWLERFGEALYGTHSANIPEQNGVWFTRKEDVLYAIQTVNPGSDLWIPGLTLSDNGTVELLGSRVPVRWEHPEFLVHPQINGSGLK